MAIELEQSEAPSAQLSGRQNKVFASLSSLGRRKQKISIQERVFFTERLGLLLETGNTLHGSLELLATQCENPSLGEVATQLADDIAGGVPFARALSAHPQAFPQVFVNLVSAGEQGGFLPKVLVELTALEERTAQLRATIKSAFTYPIFLIVFSLAVVVFVLVYVFPKFADLFSSIRDQLPLSTVLLMAASDVLRHHWALVLGLLASVIVAVNYWLNDAGGHAVLDRWKLSAPILRDVYAQLYLTQAMRVTGLSLEHGVSVPDALKASRDVVNNKIFYRFMLEVEHDVNEGRGVSGAFERAHFVPALARQLIATGEESGNLALVMKRMADHYERELSRRLENLAKLIEPAMLLVMGAVVGIIVASLILPIFKLSRAVGT